MPVLVLNDVRTLARLPSEVEIFHFHVGTSVDIVTECSVCLVYRENRVIFNKKFLSRASLQLLLRDEKNQEFENDGKLLQERIFRAISSSLERTFIN